MKRLATLHNQIRFQLLIFGVILILISGYGLLNPGEVVFYERQPGGNPVIYESAHFIIMSLVGTFMLFVRFSLLRYRRKENFSKDIPFPRNVTFEKTNDVNENIRRYNKAQQEAVKKLEK